MEIDLVSHDGGNTIGPFAFTLTVTDVATGWTENRSVPGKEAKCVLRALESIAATMPFPILGVDSALINPAATQHQIQALTAKLHKTATSKAEPAIRARVPKRARSHEATKPPSRAS